MTADTERPWQKRRARADEIRRQGRPAGEGTAGQEADQDVHDALRRVAGGRGQPRPPRAGFWWR